MHTELHYWVAHIAVISKREVDDVDGWIVRCRVLECAVVAKTVRHIGHRFKNSLARAD